MRAGSRLVLRLRADGIGAIFDEDMLPGGPTHGWPFWSENQVKTASKTLVICTERYGAPYESTEAPGVGLGAVCEAAAIRQLLYNDGGRNERFRVVIFWENDRAHVPLSLQRYHSFNTANESEYAALRAWLGGSSSAPAAVVAEPVGWPAPVPYNWTIADRLEIFDAFRKMVAGQCPERILLVEAPSNKGKTIVMSELLAYAQQAGIESPLIDFKGCPSLEEVFGSLRGDLGPAMLKRSYNSQGPERLHDLIADLQRLEKPLLLIFDTYEQAPADAQTWLEGPFLLNAGRAPGLAVVVGGQKIPDFRKSSWGRLAKVVELEPIDDPLHWIEFFQREWQVPAPAEDIRLLTKVTRGDPGLLRTLLERLAESQAGRPF